MASKTRKLEKEKEKYLGIQGEYKKLRKRALWGLIGMILVGVFFVALGIYSSDSAVLGCAGGFVLPLVLDVYYIVRCNRKIEECDVLVAKVDGEKMVWLKKLERISTEK